MTGIEISKEIFTSFTGTLFALLSAGIVWLLKSAFDKHKSENAALARYERCFASNLEIMYDNFDFLNQWIEVIENQSRPYSAHFEDYVIDDQEHYKISDLELINWIVQLNYKFRRTAADFNHLQKGYLKTLAEIDSLPAEQDRLCNLKKFHENFVPGLKKMTTNRKNLEEGTLNTIARIRLVSKVRKYSLFNCISFLFTDIWPRPTQERFNKELKQLQKDVEAKKKLNKV
jgi:hypothetical protein